MFSLANNSNHQQQGGRVSSTSSSASSCVHHHPSRRIDSGDDQQLGNSLTTTKKNASNHSTAMLIDSRSHSVGSGRSAVSPSLANNNPIKLDVSLSGEWPHNNARVTNRSKPNNILNVSRNMGHVSAFQEPTPKVSNKRITTSMNAVMVQQQQQQQPQQQQQQQQQMVPRQSLPSTGRHRGILSSGSSTTSLMSMRSMASTATKENSPEGIPSTRAALGIAGINGNNPLGATVLECTESVCSFSSHRSGGPRRGFLERTESFRSYASQRSFGTSHSQMSHASSAAGELEYHAFTSCSSRRSTFTATNSVVSGMRHMEDPVALKLTRQSSQASNVSGYLSTFSGRSVATDVVEWSKAPYPKNNSSNNNKRVRFPQAVTASEGSTDVVMYNNDNDDNNDNDLVMYDADNNGNNGLHHDRDHHDAASESQDEYDDDSCSNKTHPRYRYRKKQDHQGNGQEWHPSEGGSFEIMLVPDQPGGPE